MIPKKIHYCWFGGKPIPEHLIQYINGWKKKCSDWEFILWNEESFDIDSHSFTKSAYEHRKFAYVSDYVRAWALYEYGGVYLDTDVELKQPIDEFLVYEAFSGFEKKGLPFTAVWGAESGHSLSKKVVNYYEGKIYTINEEPNTKFISNIIAEDFKIDRYNDINQQGFDGFNTLNIFSSNYFCFDFPVNYATHHFIGSWVEGNKKISYKDYLHSEYYLEKINTYGNDKSYLKTLGDNIKFLDLLILNLRFIVSIMRKLKKKG